MSYRRLTDPFQSIPSIYNDASIIKLTMIQQGVIPEQPNPTHSKDRDCDTNASSNGDQPETPPHSKLRLCRNASSYCSDSPFCSEAHSLAELLKDQPVELEACPSFHLSLYCPLGTECRLNHNTRSVEDAVSGIWREGRGRMLGEYPELLAVRRTAYLLFL